MNKQFLLPAAVLLALGGGAAALPTATAFAQAADAPQATDQQPSAQPPSAPTTQAPRHHRSFSSHIAGRIAYLKAELKITPAQQPQFDKVAQAMRDSATEREKAFADMRGQRGQTQTAVDRLEARSKMTQLRAREDQRYLAAFKPLYDSLSADQKQAADQLLTPHHFGHRHA